MKDNRIKFSKATIQAIETPADGKQKTYYDTASRGLCVIVTPRGVKSYYVLRKYQGRVERVLLGRFPDTTVAAARRRAGEINSQFDAGHNPNRDRRAHRGELTLAELHEVYMQRHCRVHNRRPEKQAYHFKRYLHHWADRRLSAITRADVAHWHARLGEEIGQRSANIALALLRAMFNRALDWELFDGLNPTAGTRKFREVARERFLLPDELRRFAVALRQMDDSRLRDFFLLLLLTGVRKSNLLEMRWTDVSLDDAVWRIPDTKIGEPQLLPLCPQAVAVLETRRRDALVPPAEKAVNGAAAVIGGPAGGLPGQLLTCRQGQSGRSGREYPLSGHGLSERPLDRPAIDSQRATHIRTRRPVSPYVFPGPGSSGHLADPKRAWARLCGEASLADFHMHDLRRTHASYMAATGANQFVIAKALGHKSLETTAIYARLSLDPIRAAATQATDAMREASGGLL